MNNPKKLPRIRLLMIISHLLLTIFVIQWLVSRFNQEKISLEQDLAREFRSSEEKIVDSLLLVNVVNPFLHDKGKQHSQMYLLSGSGTINATDSLGRRILNGKDSSQIKSVVVNKRNNTINIKVVGDSTFTNITTAKYYKSDNSNVDSLNSPTFRERFFVNSFKVLSNRVGYSQGGTKSIYFNFTSGIDSSLLLKELLKRPISKNISLAWVTKDSTQINGSDLFILSNCFPNNIGIDVTHYTFYLLGKITPQIAFGLVLLILTGLSFIISFLSLKKQVQLNIMRNEFVGNISHELKTPVATVKVALEALQSYNIKNEPEKAEEYIQIAQKEMNRLDLLIQKVLTSSIYEDASKLLQKEKLILNEIVLEVVRTMQVRLDQQDAYITVDAGCEDHFIIADRMHLQGVLINLLDNSIKYVNEKPSIAIKIFEENKKTVLTISDNGIGIPEEYIGQVFEKFFRVPTENRHNVKGYGLGLNYSATIMKHHNGSIYVANRKEGGCTFTLIFPKITE